MFQFPSSGKVYPKGREATRAEIAEELEFQFPSSGKVYPKENPFG